MSISYGTACVCILYDLSTLGTWIDFKRTDALFANAFSLVLLNRLHTEWTEIYSWSVHAQEKDGKCGSKQVVSGDKVPRYPKVIQCLRRTERRITQESSGWACRKTSICMTSVFLSSETRLGHIYKSSPQKEILNSFYVITAGIRAKAQLIW